MYLSSSDGINNLEADGNSQTQAETQSLAIPVNPQPPSPSFPSLLVIDDNSNSNDSLTTTNEIVPKPPSPIPQLTQAPVAPHATPSNNDKSIDVTSTSTDQQRRRNSSIAKLLGGRPLENQQYDDIHQQIIDHQAAQTGGNSADSGTDGTIQRSRSSITRTLLMNSDSKTAKVTQTSSVPPSFPQDFEYLIRRELDIEHAPSTLQRNSSTPSVFQNLNSARSTPPVNPQSPSQSRMKRKRTFPKEGPSMVGPENRASHPAPFAIPNLSELDTGSPTMVPPIRLNIGAPRHQNDLLHFGTSYRHHHQQHPYPFPMPTSATTRAPGESSLFTQHKHNDNSTAHGKYRSHRDRVPTTTSSPSTSTTSSSPFNGYPYPVPGELALPTLASPIMSHTSPHGLIPHNKHGMAGRKPKLPQGLSDTFDVSMHRSQSTVSNQSNISSSSSSSASSANSVPLKKRLLHAYENERRPSSSL